MTLTCRGTDRSAEHHRVSGPAIWCRLQEHLSWPRDGGGGRGGGHPQQGGLDALSRVV